MIGMGPRKVDKPLMLYGKGNLGHLAEEIFEELGIPTHSIDKNVDWYKIENKADYLVAVCIVSSPYTLIAESLKSQGYTDVVPVWDIIEGYPEVGLHNGWFAGEMWKDEVLNIKSVHETWDDEMSRLHYGTFIHWRIMRKERKGVVLDMLASLPSTLADIRRRQRVDTFADVPMKSISIHNEGCEMKTLEVNMPLFKKWRPQISVSVYHNRDGLWEIEKTLMDSLLDYRWTFRLRAWQGQAAYLHGYPRENL